MRTRMTSAQPSERAAAERKAGWEQRRESRAAVLRRSEKIRFIGCQRQRNRRIPSAMREQLRE